MREQSRSKYLAITRALCVPIAILGLLVSVIEPSGATSVTIMTVTNAPIRIDNCYAGTRNSHAGTRDYYFDFAARFTNLSDKPIKAVRLRFDLYNEFNEKLRSLFGTDSELLDAHASRDDAAHNTADEALMANSSAGAIPIFKPTWEFINTTSTASIALCWPETVAFIDGTVWKLGEPRQQDIAHGLRVATSTLYIFSSDN